ncbi:MAG TPA: hypothetical protein VLH86_00770 [Patescibacteria group bacterium]|nr:hypothetical protein [Patescibacteria group bacterium]
MSQQTIAVDIDDVLAAGSEGFATFSNERWGTNITAEDYTENFGLAWGVPLEEALKRVDEYLASGAHGRFRHFDDALPVLQRLAKRYKLVVVTSRRVFLKPETDAWVERHFPGIFEEIRYAGFFEKSDASNVHARLQHTKAELLKELGADYLIDDQPKHCYGAAAVGVTSLLFGEYKRNRDIKELPAGVIRAKSWSEVGRYFNV